VRPLANPLGAAQLASAKARLANGEMVQVAAAGVQFAAWLSLSVLLQPFILLGGLVLVELALVGRKQRGSFWVASLFRVISTLFTYVLGVLLARYSGLEPHAGVASVLHSADPVVRISSQGTFVIAWLLAVDFLYYWGHRAFHPFPLLWRFHAVHHSPRSLAALYNFTHPIDSALVMILVFPVAFLMGVYRLDAGMVFVLMGLHQHFVHMDAPLHLGPFNRILADNRYHFVHHSRDQADYDRNFATFFPIWDRMFRTYKAPGNSLRAETGLEGQLPPQSLKQYLLAQLPEEQGGDAPRRSTSSSSSPAGEAAATVIS
jgi:sterol desaturase/sphingolipid hydroxylase (fatty acid hydroxylase superfamily)